MSNALFAHIFTTNELRALKILPQYQYPEVAEKKQNGYVKRRNKPSVLMMPKYSDDTQSRRNDEHGGTPHHRHHNKPVGRVSPFTKSRHSARMDVRQRKANTHEAEYRK